MLPCTLLLALLPHADAKDLRSRFGFGFNSQFGGVSALSLRYGLPTAKPTTNVQLELDAGASLLNGDATTFAGGRLLYGVVAEDNLNLYAGVGAGYGSATSNGTEVTTPTSFVRIQPSLGAEFFFFGLENLGFTVEWGVNLDLGTSFGLQTIGTAPAVGVHYYF